MYYVLRGKIAVKVDSVEEWAKEFEGTSRIVKQEEVNGKYVSTVFLGINHNYGDGDPLLFETMVFPERGEWGEEYCKRYTTWEEAEQGHKKVVEDLKLKELKSPDVLKQLKLKHTKKKGLN